MNPPNPSKSNLGKSERLKNWKYTNMKMMITTKNLSSNILFH